MLRRALLILFLCTLSEYTLAQNADEWWRDTFVYQVYPRSFKDGNGDGVGDLNGITSKLEHLADLGVSALWLSPIYTSPMVDFGYDIANFTNIDSIFGTLDDFSRLVAKAKTLKLKVVLDFVPNHSSDKHAWFPKSVQRIKPYDEYYIWKDAKMVNGTRKPPNNWLSAFQGSAWTWNDQRKQYYLHQFAAGQPDLNYRSSALQEEMKNVLRFWINRGVDGIRIDTIPNLIEDARFLDEPKIPNTGLPDTDPGTLQHIYTADQDETYDILKSWRQVLDSSNGTRKIILTEAWTSLPLTMKYYDYGSNVPFNFMFINQLNKQSSPLDFKRLIDRYLNSIPRGQQPNWVVGNHDSHRAGSRYGEQRADQIPMIAAVLPGVGVLYNGDEIGMIDRPLSWAETVDPAGCNAGPGRYNATSRDPERTPFQWDNTTSAGFSTNPKTWLPVHPNYKTLNLAAQKTSPTSHYGITKQLVALKKDPIIRIGSTQLIVAGEDVLGIVRRLDQSRTIALLINFANKPIKIDASAWLNIPSSMSVLVASVGSKIAPGTRVNTVALNLPAAASLILK